MMVRTSSRMELLEERNEDVVLEPQWAGNDSRVRSPEVDRERVLHNNTPSLVNVGASEEDRKHFTKMNVEEVQDEVLLVFCTHAVVDPPRMKEGDWSYGQ